MKPGIKPARPAKKAIPARETNRHPAVFYSLHNLLDTLRTLQTFEDQLCSLLHEIGRTGQLDTALRRDLRSLLREMPTQQYGRETAAVERDLIAKPKPSGRAAAAVRKAATSASPRSRKAATSAVGARPARKAKTTPRKKVAPKAKPFRKRA